MIEIRWTCQTKINIVYMSLIWGGILKAPLTLPLTLPLSHVFNGTLIE